MNFIYENIFSDVITSKCSTFSCKNKGQCLATLAQTIYEDSLILSAFSLLLWIGLHKFWSAFLFHTNLDYFRKMKSSESSLDDKTQRVVLKPNLENCSLNAYHAINLLYYMNLSIMGTLHLIAGYGTVSIGIAIPFMLSGIGYHIYIWLWHFKLPKKARVKFEASSSCNYVHHFTGIALYTFTLYYTCQELAAHKNDLPFSESSAAASSEYSRLLHLHLAEKTSVIGSAILRQFSINAFPMLAIKLYEFQHIQINPDGARFPSFMGIRLVPRVMLYLQIVFGVLISPIAIGQSNQGYVIAVVLLFFLRQIYMIYCTAKAIKAVQFS